MEDKGYIYKITNKINNKIYIGKTSKSLEKRFQEHIATAKRYLKDSNNELPESRLYPAMNKYGYENFIINVVEEVLLTEINDKEKYYIDLYNCLNDKVGYNISPGGLGGELFKGHHHSDESKIKMSQHNYWKTHEQPEEIRKKRSETIRKTHNLYIQCLNTGEIFNSYKAVKEKYNIDVRYAIENKTKCRNNFYILLPNEYIPIGYPDNERLKLLTEYENNYTIKINLAREKSTQALKNLTTEQRKQMAQKAIITNNNKSEEEKRKTKSKISKASIENYNKLPIETKERLKKDSSNRMKEIHKNRTSEQKEKINKLNSKSQKGKKIFKNIITNEVKTICPKDFTKYDFNIWKECHRNGDLITCQEN